jgi:SAM-dependent methyltransferase
MFYEAEVLVGLERFAVAELMPLAQRVSSDRPGAVWFEYEGDLRALRRLRTITAIYAAGVFDVPRPRGLLGHQHFAQIVAAVRYVIDSHPQDAFHTLHVSAAGDDTAVMRRFIEDLAQQVGLAPAADEGDLLVRLRRARDGDGWEVLVRISPRPLSVRAWRVCNRPGAPNAALAACMMQLSGPRADDRFLNICCGSGTLLVERLLQSRTQRAVGCDTDAAALACAGENLRAAGLEGRAALEGWDARELPLESGSMSVICADLPFGQLVGTHAENETLYPQLIAEAARVAAPGARMVLLTHEVRLLEQALARYEWAWAPVERLRVRSGGMTPGIYVLRRR